MQHTGTSTRKSKESKETNENPFHQNKENFTSLRRMFPKLKAQVFANPGPQINLLSSLPQNVTEDHQRDGSLYTSYRRRIEIK